MIVLGVDAGSPDVPAAEHTIHDLIALLGRPALACTHFIRSGRPHVAISLALDTLPAELPAGYGLAWEDRRTGPEELAAGAELALAEHTSGAGRAVLFPGSAHLTGTLTVGELVDRSAISAVTVLASATPPAPETLLDTRGYLRPERKNGILTLATTPGLLPDGSHGLVPFEIVDPQACCGGH
ncbi:hypothetical protein [Acrocarpospora catenulata]|uniref:hypothetical protein n=1 Tax=Acrocarpospora catenulata TaxID=2836182 RepID=UPI001BD9D900|nr:hypothetical protein [Acrocarpospora catenulata]